MPIPSWVVLPEYFHTPRWVAEVPSTGVRPKVDTRRNLCQPKTVPWGRAALLAKCQYANATLNQAWGNSVLGQMPFNAKLSPAWNYAGMGCHNLGSI